jgi:hypothetical protein
MNKVGLGKIIDLWSNGTQVVRFLTDSGSKAIPRGANLYLSGLDRCASGRIGSKVRLDWTVGQSYALWFARLCSPDEWKRLTKDHRIE